MFTQITGATGAGKTFLTVKFILKDWYSGENIRSNIDLYTKKFKRYFRKPKKPGSYLRFEHIEDTYHMEECTILFDDAGKVFNSKRWADISLEFADKLQTSRHDLLHFYATAPSIKRIYNEFRQLVHNWIYCEKLFGIGTERFNLFSLHRYRYLDIDDIETCEDDKLANPVSRYKYFVIWLGSKRYYDTHAKISNRKYKMTWSMIENRRILTILPNTLQLKDAMNLWRSLKSGYTQSKPRS